MPVDNSMSPMPAVQLFMPQPPTPPQMQQQAGQQQQRRTKVDPHLDVRRTSLRSAG